MDDLNDIFTNPEEAAGDSADELDMALATGGEVLQKIASEEGIDLDALGEDDIADLLVQLQGGQAGVSEPDHTKEASQNTMSYDNEITYADVAAELAKTASANGIDLDQVSREEYHQAFDALAEQMSDPSYFEKKAEAQEKLAEADAIGRAMARSFLDELDGGQAKVASRWKAIKDSVMGAERGAAGRVGGWTRKVPGGEKAHAALKRRFQGDVVPTNAMDGNEAAAKAQRVLGRSALAGSAAAGTAAGGGAVAYKRRKGRDGDKEKQSFDEAFESDAIAYANTLLVENGLADPRLTDTEFSKFAAFADDDYAEAVESRAWELLAEHGYVD